MTGGRSAQATWKVRYDAEQAKVAADTGGALDRAKEVAQDVQAKLAELLETRPEVVYAAAAAAAAALLLMVWLCTRGGAAEEAPTARRAAAKKTDAPTQDDDEEEEEEEDDEEDEEEIQEVSPKARSRRSRKD